MAFFDKDSGKCRHSWLHLAHWSKQIRIADKVLGHSVIGSLTHLLTPELVGK